MIALLYAIAVVAQPQQGAVIVNNPAPDFENPVFRLSAAPILRLGGENANTNLELFDVQHAVNFASGKILVLPGNFTDHLNHVEARAFASNGAFLRRLGRAGDGPGEFRRAVRVFEAGRDSVAVFDTARHTVTLFAPDGRVLSTLSGVAQARCCFSDGSALVTNFVPGEGQRVARSGAITSLPGATHPSSTSRPTLSFSVVSFREPTRARTTVLTVDGDDPEFMLPPRSTPQGVVYIGTQVRPFMRRAYIELAADEIVYGIPDSYEYKVFSRSGALLRTVRAAITPEPVTAAERDSLRNNFEDRRRGPDMTSAYTEAWRTLQLPATKPAYGQLLAEPNGTIWIRNRYSAAGNEWLWAAFDRQGKLIGTLRTPAAHRVLSFGHGNVILARNTGNDSVTLFVHRIERVAR